MPSRLPNNPTTVPPAELPHSADVVTLAAIGQLASKVAHELNNPLDGIMRYISMAQRKIKASQMDGVERYLADAQFGLQRMAEVLRELLEYSRAAHPASPPTELHYLIHQAIQTMQPAADLHRISIVFQSVMPSGLTAPANLYQVLCNLLKNAIDAIPASPPTGVITLATALDPPTGATPTHFIIHVTDNGPGIPETDLPHIFEPFFSRKSQHADSAGTGLGLAICKEIIDRMQGHILVRNLPAGQGPGCQFTLRIPLSLPSFTHRGTP